VTINYTGRPGETNMSFLTKLFGKGKKKINIQVTKVDEEKPGLKPEGTGTTLRKPEGPELTALEIANRKDWEVKTLPTWKPGDVILGTYEVEDVISGGMGHVYIANHNKWNVKLAIKSPNEKMLSDRELFARILREANSWTELGLHPNIAYCYYVRNIEDVPHIVVEYVDGGNLRQWIEDGKCIDYRTNMDLAIQFCHGMEYAHSKGMIHRDIKPENVLMTKDGILKITDFGLVRSGESTLTQDNLNKHEIDVDSPNLTKFGTFMGTPGYISPEQVEDPANVDERADIFSFGVCLYEMFCGNKPYRITYGEKQDAPDPVKLSGDKKFPPSLSNILLKSVQWFLSNRYTNFIQIRQGLTQIYQMLYKEEGLYKDLKLVDIKADGLNNRGVSYLELQNEQDAIKCFDEALEKNMTHPEAVFNRSLMQWRTGEITDTEVLARLDNCWNNPEIEKEKIAELKAFIYQESFNPEAAREILIEYPGKSDNLFLGREASAISMVRIMEGHKEYDLPVTITPNGRYVVAGGEDNTLLLWEFETGKCVRTIEGHTNRVTSLAITPDSRYAVSGNKEDMTLRMWDLEMGRCLRIMEGHTEGVRSVAITHDGRLAVSGSGNRIYSDIAPRIWELESGECLRTIKGHKSPASSVTITPDGRYAIFGSEDSSLRVCELETGQCLRTMEGHTDEVTSVAITPDSRYAVSGSKDMTLRIWDLETGRCIRTMKGHTKYVLSVAITPDSRYAISGSEDMTLRIWDLETGQCIRTMEGHTNQVNSVAITPDGRYAVSGSWDRTLRVWTLSLQKTYRSQYMVSRPKGFREHKVEEDVLNRSVRQARELYEKSDYSGSYSILYNAWKKAAFHHSGVITRLFADLMEKGRLTGLNFFNEIKLLNGHTNSVNSVAITPDGRYAVSGSFDETLVWEIETGRCICTMQGPSLVKSIAITPDGRYAISGNLHKTLRVFELKTGRCIRTMEGHTNYVNTVAITPDGRYAVSGGWDSLRVWEIKTGQCLRKLEAVTPNAFSVAITPDSLYAIARSWNILKVWEIETGRCIRSMEGYGNTVAITPDSRYAVSESGNTLSVWEIETGRCFRTMEGHKGKVNTLAITPDGLYAVSGSSDNTLRVWEIETGQCICTMKGHIMPVNTVAITPNGLYAISGSKDKTLRIWRFIWNLEFD
jgi:WD40 repeat protein/serine/threonine protein kinase